MIIFTLPSLPRPVAVSGVELFVLGRCHHAILLTLAISRVIMVGVVRVWVVACPVVCHAVRVAARSSPPAIAHNTKFTGVRGWCHRGIGFREA